MAVTEKDISYRTIDNLELLGRHYSPEGEGPAPYIVDVHGGAWREGDRMNNQVIHQKFAAAGIGVFALDFRLSTQAPYPVPVQDANYGVRWFKKNASTIGANPSTIGGLGSSSGGQQMGLVALQPNDPAYVIDEPSLTDTDASLDFFIGCWPILDPLARYKMAQEKGKDNLVEAHGVYFADESEMAVGNPYMVLDRGEATHLPATALVQGEEDQNVDHFRVDIFAERYREAGGNIEVHKYAGEPHTFVVENFGNDASEDAIAKLVAFVHGVS
ncbi:MAG: alpha/beta hydrolase [Rhodospirillaceae bacterium]|nr:alpha/beta hydrolase [Rhodospirillaceae bacterium]|tara:strand:+ start:51727 stop:52542 length:816 start_codon:yes stop_codon:yes gene_type:complete